MTLFDNIGIDRLGYTDAIVGIAARLRAGEEGTAQPKREQALDTSGRQRVRRAMPAISTIQDLIDNQMGLSARCTAVGCRWWARTAASGVVQAGSILRLGNESSPPSAQYPIKATVQRSCLRQTGH